MLLKDIPADRGDDLPPKDVRYQIWPVLVIFGYDRTHVLMQTHVGPNSRENSLVTPGRFNYWDVSFAEGLKRLKCQQLGSACRLKVLSTFSLDIRLSRPAGQQLILPHYFVEHIEGDVTGSRTQFRWTSIEKLNANTFTTERVVETVRKVRRFPEIAEAQDYLVL